MTWPILVKFFVFDGLVGEYTFSSIFIPLMTKQFAGSASNYSQALGFEWEVACMIHITDIFNYNVASLIKISFGRS